MLLNDLFGYFRRNIKNMSEYEKEQMLYDIKRIQNMLEKDLKIKEVV